MDIERFVQNVKFYCAAKGIKPTNACRESGAGKSLIDQMERRGSVPSVEKVQLLARYLGVTTSELLGEISPGQSAARAVPKPGTGPPPDVVTLHDSTVWLNETDAQRLTVSEVALILSYRRADERTRTMVQLALEPFGKEKTTSAG